METSGVEDIKSMALFAELNPEPVIRFDEKGVVIRANQAALEAFGIENLEGENISDVLTDIGNIDIVDFIQKNKIQKLQMTLGRRVYRFMLRGIEEHGVCQIYGSDVTEKYRAQQKAESMALFAELNPEPVLRFDFTGKILQANQAANEAFSRDNLTNMNIIDFIPELSAFHIPDFIKGNRIESLEITFDNRVFNFQLRGIDSLKVCQIYGTDITKRVLAEREVIQKQKSITDSIRYASLIQNAVLPNPQILEQYTTEHFVLFQPRDIVSGDFYWFAERENKLVVAAADCTGHGVPGAFMSMLGISFLNEIVHTTHCCAEKILNQLRDKVISTLSQSG
ncbi:MAG: PAS domain-containing protein, partial [Bacteroidales bacterium]|nr:PAS domain-containing protein [Bacteroidales bacterium]